MNDQLITELLAEHKTTKETLEKAKDRERKLRDKIILLVFPFSKKGTNKKSFKDAGIEVKAVLKDSWSVKQDGLDEILCEHEGIQRAFKYKYDLVMAGYNSLSDDEKKLLAEQVTCKDAAPELSYEGELGESHLDTIKTESGVIIANGVVLSASAADAVARYYGFQHAEELVKFLEEIQ